MQFELSAAGDVIKRLRLVEGRIGGVIRMLEDGRECSDVVTQLAAASHALQRAGFKLVSTGLRQCTAPAEEATAGVMTVDQMERLFLSLA